MPKIFLQTVFFSMLSAVTAVFAVGCVAREPEGPAETIGKGIDMITRGLDSYDQQRARTGQPKPREESRPYGDYDPYYDGAPAEYGDEDEYDRRQR